MQLYGIFPGEQIGIGGDERMRIIGENTVLLVVSFFIALRGQSLTPQRSNTSGECAGATQNSSKSDLLELPLPTRKERLKILQCNN